MVLHDFDSDHDILRQKANMSTLQTGRIQTLSQCYTMQFSLQLASQWFHKTWLQKVKSTSTASVIHGAMSFATCVAIVLQDKLQVGCSV